MMDDGDAGAAQLLQLRGRDGEAARQLGVADGAARRRRSLPAKRRWL